MNLLPLLRFRLRLRFLGNAYLRVAEHLVVIHISFLKHLHHRILRDSIGDFLRRGIVLLRIEWFALRGKRRYSEFFEHIVELPVHQLHSLAQPLAGLVCLGRVLDRKRKMVHDAQQFTRHLLIRIFFEIREIALHALSVILKIRVCPEIPVMGFRRFLRFLIKGLRELFYFCGRRCGR